ncbi:diaminopimelate decarboxylase family protein [Actinoplanes sp. CA-030573]|uniref:diaminopimelate decarboxylase family protein n=1 Tax=Actinoplanes sp. CA-030573 TaxID=3239898 RepID=UPI003D8F7D76
MTLTDIIPSLRTSLRPALDPAVWPCTARWNADGELSIGGCGVTELTAAGDSPVYVLDRRDVESRCAGYVEAFGADGVAYAGQAGLSFGLARIIAGSGVGCVVRSGGDVRLATAAGFPGDRVTLSGGGKSFEDCEAAYGCGAVVVVGNAAELAAVAANAPAGQRVLVRVLPAGSARGYGFRLGSGPALAAVRTVLAAPNLVFEGLDCPAGHEISRFGRYEAVVREVLASAAVIAARHRVPVPRIELGGGHAVAYAPGDNGFAVRAFAARIRALVRLHAERYRIAVPRLSVAPGRALVAQAGVTLYRVAEVSPSVDGRLVVSVHGGLTDCRPRALCESRHTALLANRQTAAATGPATVVGRHREADETVVHRMQVPRDVAAGDVIAVASTGAYHQSQVCDRRLGGWPPMLAVANGRRQVLVAGRSAQSLLTSEVSR